MQENEENNSENVSQEQTHPEETELSLIQLKECWPGFTLEERKEKFSKLPRTDAEELFLGLNAHDQAELIVDVSPLEKRSWVRLLAPDDVADLIQELGLEIKEDILALLDPQTRREVTALLAYAEDDAGGLMNSHFVRLRPDMSVDEAISYMRIQAKSQIETIYYSYVIDADQTLVGVVSFRELFASPPHKKIREIMNPEVISVPVGLDQEQVAKVFTQHDLLMLPVVDEWGHIKGVVTFDDIASVIQEETTEDIHKIAAVEHLDAPYMKTSLFDLVRKRGVWLIILFFSEMFTASAMSHYQNEIEKAVVLALFIPLIISSGGNTGSQASTLIIRAMALGEIRLRDWWRVLIREIGIGACLGFILGLIGLSRIVFWPGKEALYGEHYIIIGATVATTVAGVVMWGTITGSMLPFVLRRLGLDPASASAPFVATLVDVTGLIIYFSLASQILAGTLL